MKNILIRNDKNEYQELLEALIEKRNEIENKKQELLDIEQRLYSIMKTNDVKSINDMNNRLRITLIEPKTYERINYVKSIENNLLNLADFEKQETTIDKDKVLNLIPADKLVKEISHSKPSFKITKWEELESN